MIPVTEFINRPFNLTWGANITARVVASNFYGSSVTSNPGGGAIILTSPGPPLNLVENAAQRTKTTLGLGWSSPNFTGGSPIINY